MPTNLIGYAIPGDDHPFLILGTRAVTAFPKDLEGAEALFAGSRLRPAQGGPEP